MQVKNFNYDVSYVNIGSDPVNGIISCGFLPKKKEIRKHNFAYYGGFLVLSGTGQYLSKDGQCFPLEQGSFVQRRPGISHTTIIEDKEPWLEFYVCFGAQLYHTLVTMDMISSEPVLRIKIDTSIVRLCENLLFDFKKAKEKDKKRLLILVQNFLLHINEVNDEVLKINNTEEVINKLTDIMSCNFDRDIDLQEFAKIYHMSYEKLRKEFKEQTGVSPHHYLIMQRMNEARRLLHQLNIPIKEISFRLGYKDQYAFSNQFKSMVGVSPKQFRKTY